MSETSEEIFLPPELPKRTGLPKGVSKSEVLRNPNESKNKNTKKRSRRVSYDGTAAKNYPHLTPETTPKTTNKTVSKFFSKLKNDETTVTEETRKRLGKQLQNLVVKGEIAAMEVLLQQGADPNGGGGDRTPLFTATDVKNIEAIELLLEHNASMVRPVKLRGNESNPLKLALEDPDIAPIFLNRLQALEKKRNFTFDDTDAPPLKIQKQN